MPRRRLPTGDGPANDLSASWHHVDVRFGLITPVLTLSRIHNQWEEAGTISDALRIVQAADRLGYHHVTCAEHVAVPRAQAKARGGRYWAPLPTLGYFAALTERVRLVTHSIVIGYHHPLEILKNYSSLDRLSNGRLILGIGVGSLREEFELLGAPFQDRGRRADDALVALRQGFGITEPAYRGTYYRYDGFVIDPTSVQNHVPFWIGGRSWRSLERAMLLGDGWAPFGLTEAELGSFLSRARESQAWRDRALPLEVVLVPEPALDPMNQPDNVLEAVARHRSLGATVLNLYLRHDSASHCIEQMEAFVELTSAYRQGEWLTI
jgi:probable F420-dependent oxidoreductase